MTFGVATGIKIAAADAPNVLPPGFAPGKPFKVGLRSSKVPAFGGKLEEYATTSCYGCEVPNVLIALWVALVRGDGLKAQGIFRLAPDPAAALLLEKQLNKGQIPPGSPPEVLAHLIKSFLRRLPGGLFGRVPKDSIEGVKDAAGYKVLCGKLHPLERNVLEWLVRVICEVSRPHSCHFHPLSHGSHASLFASLLSQVAGHKHVNMMGLRNLTLVIAPNLLVSGSEGSERAPKPKVGLFGTKRGSTQSSQTPAPNPVEELMNIELVSNALHTLAAASVRFSL